MVVIFSCSPPAYLLPSDRLHYYPRDIQTSSSLTQEQENDFIKYVLEKYTKELISTESAQDITQHASLVKQHVSQGKKVVIVGHSLGTFYANSIYDGLSASQKEAVGLMYIAPGVGVMSDGSESYVTSEGDNIIPLMTMISNQTQNMDIDPPLTVNQPDRFPSSTQWNHGVNEYLQYYGTQILSLINSVEEGTTVPTSTSGNGPLTVQLDWDSQPDLDLHMFQPNGFHIDWRNQVGHVGQLDVDDTDGFGPEHIYTQCDNIEIGTYGIYVNYYSGNTGTS